MKQINLLQRQPDGAFIDWGRNVTVNGMRGEGGAVFYRGEAAEVMELLLKHTAEDDRRSSHELTHR